MHKKNMVKGTLILGLGGIFAKLLGFFFRIPLIYMIGEEGIGLYQLTYPLYSFLLGISAGLPIALSKMIAERLAQGRQGEVGRILKIAMIILGVFGGLASAVLILFSNRIITLFHWNEKVKFSLLGIALAPFFTCILSAYKGYFQGIQLMMAPAISQIVEQLVRILAGVGLAYMLLPGGIAAAAGGASFGAALGSAIGLLWMLYCFKKVRIPVEDYDRRIPGGSLAAEILKLAIPISLGQAIGSVMALIDSIMVPGLLRNAGYSEQLATQLYGQLTGKAFVLVNIPLTLSIALAQTIVPAISESFAIGGSRLSHNVRMAYKLAMIIALPCAGGLAALAKPILILIFGGEGEGWQLLQILAIASIFIIIAQTSTSILNGVGRVIAPVGIILIGGLVKINISLRLIPISSINIRAAAYGTLISYGIVAFIDLIFVVKSTKVTLHLIEAFILPGFCALTMTCSAIFIYSFLYTATGSNGVSVIATVFLATAVYGLMLELTRTMRLEDIKRMVAK